MVLEKRKARAEGKHLTWPHRGIGPRSEERPRRIVGNCGQVALANLIVNR